MARLTGDKLPIPTWTPQPLSEPVRGVWLDREGEYIVVRIQRDDGLYYEAIREHQDTNFSHNISAAGIRALNEPVPWLNERQSGD